LACAADAETGRLAGERDDDDSSASACEGGTGRDGDEAKRSCLKALGLTPPAPPGLWAPATGEEEAKGEEDGGKEVEG
jgi:hypothetical protein